MSVKKEASGRRSIQVEVEVPGTPEEVWRTIATGPGITAWFVPTEVEERDGVPVAMTLHFGPGMDSITNVTAWDPPRRFTAESGGLGPEAPPLATEWIVEARSGGTCVVRVVHSLFASSDDWDDQLESVESGWPGFFRILWLYLTHFREMPCSSFSLMTMTPEPEPKAWETLTASLGLAGATTDQRRSAPAGAPPLAGLVEWTGQGGQHPRVLLLRTDVPVPGVVSLGAFTMGGKTCLMLSFYLYGDGAADAAVRNEPLWQEWMGKRFSSVGDGAVGQAGTAA